METAARALRSRPLSERRLRARLHARGVRRDAEESAVAGLAQAGFVDDARLAVGRTAALVEKGWGDAAVIARLTGEGLGQAEVERALAKHAPEGERARRLAAGLPPRQAWGLLGRRGFSAETIEDVLGTLDVAAADGLG
jgi:SOS response regulatory protein OraA/RecX